MALTLHSVQSPSVIFDLFALANGSGSVLVGRDSDAAIHMDAPEVPLLLSRRHAHFTISQHARKVLLTDLNSTNGTYVARQGLPLQKLPAHVPWEVLDGDTLGFGGPEHVCSTDSTIRNPFIFSIHHSNALQPRQLLPALMAEDRDDVMQGDQLGADIQYGSAKDSTSAAQPAANARGQQHDFADVCCHTSDQAGVGVDEQAQLQRQPPGTPGAQVMRSVLATHLSCPICHDWLVASHTLSCGHMFCGLCLAKWLEKGSNCPSCRAAVAGVPVRCFQVDSTINDLLNQGLAVASPTAKQARQLKQARWESVQGHVVPAWDLALQKRQQQAVQLAERFHRSFMAQEPFPDAAGRA